MVDLYFVLKDIGVDASYYEKVSVCWNISMRYLPKEPTFLAPENIEACGRIGGVSDELIGRLQALGARIQENHSLKAFAWHVYYRLAVWDGYPLLLWGGSYVGWPIPGILSDDEKDLFYLLFANCINLRALDAYRKQGIPEEVSSRTLARFKGQQRISFSPHALAWQRNYMYGAMFHIGRFEFRLFREPCVGMVLRNKADHSRAILCPPGVRYDKDGFYALAKHEAATDVVSTFVETDSYWCGFPVDDRRGAAILEKKRFLKSEWDVDLKVGDWVCDMHIPGGGGMTPQVAQKSFEDVFAFLDSYLPNRCKPVIRCNSWIFNEDFAELQPEGNMAALMRRCHLFPMPSTGDDGFFFVFGEEAYDPQAPYPEDTSMRRAMLSILRSGRKLRSGGMVLFKDEVRNCAKISC